MLMLTHEWPTCGEGSPLLKTESESEPTLQHEPLSEGPPGTPHLSFAQNPRDAPTGEAEDPKQRRLQQDKAWLAGTSTVRGESTSHSESVLPRQDCSLEGRMLSPPQRK